jgi:hypothetical protein
LFSKYTGLYVCCTCSKKRTSKPTVEFLKDSIAGNKRYLKLRISPNRVNRYDIFANKKMVFYDFRANSATHINQKEPSLTEKEKTIELLCCG